MRSAAESTTQPVLYHELSLEAARPSDVGTGVALLLSSGRCLHAAFTTADAISSSGIVVLERFEIDRPSLRWLLHLMIV